MSFGFSDIAARYLLPPKLNTANVPWAKVVCAPLARWTCARYRCPALLWHRIYAIPNVSSKHAATSTQSWQPLKAGARQCAQDLSHLRFEAYDTDFNRTLAAAKTLRSLDEVRKCVKRARRCTICFFFLPGEGCGLLAVLPEAY